MIPKFAARLFLRVTGWEVEGGRPIERKFVLIAAPHTSNWDFPYLMAFAAIYDVRISWFGKHNLFRWPFGGLMRRLGGIPVHRHRRNNLVEALAAEFAGREELALVVPAEATRAYTPYWKSGFYHIARTASVPIVMSFLDYERRCGGFGPALLPSSDLRADMDEIRAFYADKIGRHPEQFGEIRLKEES